jgi:hypothetical protein
LRFVAADGLRRRGLLEGGHVIVQGGADTGARLGRSAW